jgi:hypothetical protein
MNTAEPTPIVQTSTCCGKTKSVALWALVILNAALVMVLASRHVPENKAQAAGGVNASEILAVPGNLPGMTNGVVFLIDSRSGLLTAISYDGPTNKMTSLPTPIDINRQIAAAGGARGR